MDTSKFTVPPAPSAENLEHIGPITARTLAALEERYRHELMDELERLELRERIVRMKRKAGRSELR